MGEYDGNSTWEEITNSRLSKNVLPHGTTLPTAGTNKIEPNGLFLKTDTGILYENTGSLATPTWTSRLSSGSSPANAIVMAHSTTIGDYTTPSSASYDEGKEAGITITHASDGWFLYEPSDTKPLDGDDTTSTRGQCDDISNARQMYDFGSVASRTYSIKWSYNLGSATGPMEAYLQYSNDATTWVNIFSTSYSSTTEVVRTDTFTVSCRYVHVIVLGLAVNVLPNFRVYQLYTAPALSDNNTATVHTTTSATNPAVYTKLSSSGIICGIALWWDAGSTETEIAIRISTDATFTSGENVRVITTSGLTAGAYNYIRFNPVTGQYIQIYGNSGAASKILAIGEIKALIKTESQIIVGHGHLPISTSSTTIALDGT